jgi:single-strand DNA-binding protein
MARDWNKITFTGRLGRDIDLKYTKNGEAVATFSVASNRSVRDETEQSGWKDETEWFRVVAWRELAERMAKSLTKGTRVLIEGRIQTQEYTDKQGQRQRSTEVIASDYMLLERKPNADNEGDSIDQNFSNAPVSNRNGVAAASRNGRPNSRYAAQDDEEIDAEDIPF